MTAPTSTQVLEALKTRAPRAMHVGEICAHLGIEKSQRGAVITVLDALVERRMATELPGMRYRVKKGKTPRAPSGPNERPQRKPREQRPQRGERRDRPRDDRPRTLVRGRLAMTARGFGFVSAEDGLGEVFIPAPYVGRALHGDHVEIWVRPSSRGREGGVEEVLDRGTKRLTGRLEMRGKYAWLTPDSIRLPGPMRIVGDLPKKLTGDDVVLAEIVQYPREQHDHIEVSIVEVLGARGITRVEVQRLKIEHGVVEEFPEEVLEEAKAFGAQVPPEEVEAREDLREVGLLTIDPADARDHDDAICVERTADGFKVVIAIADVAHYVRPGTALDREALLRGTSIYLPDRAIPMLPHDLSTHLASLVPGHDRLCMAVEVELGPSGGVKKHRLIEGVMCSRGKLTYEGVAKHLGLTEEGPDEPEAETYTENLQALADLAKALRTKRLRRGTLDFDLPEARVRLDRTTGEPETIYQSRTDPGVREAYRMVEEMMLLANEVIATDLSKRGAPAIYRVHPKPDPEKMVNFARVAEAFGVRLDEDVAEKPKALQQVLKRIEGTPTGPVLSFLLLRAMQQAFYHVSNDGHFGLAARNYLHFTSPIRRYPDLAVHRVVKQVIRKEKIKHSKLREAHGRQAAESSRLERRAMQAERDAVSLYGCVLMRDRVGEEFEATLSRLGEGFAAMTLDDPFVQVSLPLDRLEDEFRLDEMGIRLSSRSGASLELGDRFRVRLEDVSIEAREMIVLPTSRIGGSASKLKHTKGGAPKRAKGSSKRKGRDERGKKTSSRSASSKRGDKGGGRKSRRDEGPSKGKRKRSPTKKR